MSVDWVAISTSPCPSPPPNQPDPVRAISDPAAPVFKLSAPLITDQIGLVSRSFLALPEPSLATLSSPSQSSDPGACFKIKVQD